MANHHGDNNFPEALAKAMAEANQNDMLEERAKWLQERLGATGDHPEGKLSEDDDGALRFALVPTVDGQVRIDFGTPVVWLQLSPEQAMHVAQQLIKMARAVSRTPLVFEL